MELPCAVKVKGKTVSGYLTVETREGTLKKVSAVAEMRLTVRTTPSEHLTLALT